MKGLSPESVAIVQQFMKGVRLKKFNESVAVLNESLAQGAWTKRGSVKAQSGFYQGCGVHYDPYKPGQGHTREYALSASLSMCLRYGQTPQTLENDAMTEEAIALIPPEAMKGTTVAFIHAWIALCIEKDLAVSILNAARPLPVITSIGLSPKVTATLKEMDLDINLPSIEMAKLGIRMVPGFDKSGEPLLNPDGSSLLVPHYFVDWTPGTKFNRSRFSHGNRCQACGKPIPSGRYVPIEADDLTSGDHLGFWIGCDCARNIFGIKDVGIERKA